MPKQRTPKPDGLTGALIRKSRVDYPEGCTTPEDRTAHDESIIRDRQAELVADAARDGKTIDRWYIDLAVTGQARGESKRTGLAACRADAEDGTLTLLYTRDLSRIYRSVVKQEMFFADMERWGCTVRAQDIPQVGDPATQRLIRQNIGALNEFLAQRTGRLMEDRRLRNVREGLAVGQANSQWGLAYDPALKGYRYDPATADRACLVFEALRDARGVAMSACRHLNRMWDEGHPHATRTPDGVPWRPTTLLQFVRKGVYRRRAVRGATDVAAPHLIPEVVPPELVADVDRLLALRAPLAMATTETMKAGRLDYTYGPLLRCGGCGARLSACKTPLPRPPGDVYADGATWPRWIAWRCSVARQSFHTCPEGARFQQWRLDRLVARVLAEAFRQSAPSAPIPGKARPKPRKDGQKNTRTAALATLTTRRQNCLDMFERGLLKDMDELAARIAAIDAEESRLSALLPEETAEPEPGPALRVSAAEWERLQTAFAHVYQPVTMAQMMDMEYRDAALEPGKHELLKSLGMMLFVRFPLLPTSAARKRGERLVVVADVAALGLTGARALTREETDADLADYARWLAWAKKHKRL